MAARDRRVHIVGAGLAGLACAVRLARAGVPVTLHEAASQAGGRCRSWRDETLGRTIDNGNHLLLSGNREALAYLDAIGAADELAGPATAAIPFLDLLTGTRWTLRPNAGGTPWWLFVPSRRAAGGGALAHLAGLRRLRRAAADATVAEALHGNRLYRRLWEPLAVSILNTPAERGSARLLWRVFEETLGAGGAACRPLVARRGLAPAFVDPASRLLLDGGAELCFHHRLTGLARTVDRVTGLRFAGSMRTVDRDDRVVLALPAQAVNTVMPEPVAPAAHHAIVNVHFRLERPAGLPGGAPLLGLVGGTAQWLFQRGDVVSATISAADALAEWEPERIARLLWGDVALALRLPPGPPPDCRVVKERRATFAQTPQQAAARPGPRTAYSNLLLAGDWTDTGLPATIEGAVRSGNVAAAAVLEDFAGGDARSSGIRPAPVPHKGRFPTANETGTDA